MSDRTPKTEDMIESVMSRHIYCADAEDDLMSAIRIMYSRRCSCVVVTREGQVCGILTERDIVRLAASHLNSLDTRTVSDAMTSSVVTIGPETTVVEAAYLMRTHRCRRFPVVAPDGTLLGLVTQSDIVTAAKRSLEQHSHRLEREVEERTRSLQLANQELVRLSVTDPLTGLYNRRFLFKHMDQEIARLERDGGHLTCIMIDIDRFKQINDTYGHESGDQVLARLAQTMRDEIRPYDVAARYGGEEFIIVMSSDESTAAGVADRVREEVLHVRFKHGRTEFGITLSAGVAGRRFPSITCDPDSLIARSDAALYAAKASGRNCIIQASSLDSTVDSYSPDLSRVPIELRTVVAAGVSRGR